MAFSVAKLRLLSVLPRGQSGRVCALLCDLSYAERQLKKAQGCLEVRKGDVYCEKANLFVPLLVSRVGEHRGRWWRPVPDAC